jgi:hypothetical protein
MSDAWSFIVAVTIVLSVAKLLGVKTVLIVPVELVNPELGVSVAVNPVDGYSRLEKANESGTPCWRLPMVAVSVRGALPATKLVTPPVMETPSGAAMAYSVKVGPG